MAHACMACKYLSLAGDCKLRNLKWKDLWQLWSKKKCGEFKERVKEVKK